MTTQRTTEAAPGSGDRRLRILVLGDSYCPAAALQPAFSELAAHHTVDLADVVDDTAWQPATASELAI
ncbi:MAG: hypothetical protein ACHQZR_10010, partial [Candidatus Limnocylindrales bacterium]